MLLLLLHLLLQQLHEQRGLRVRRRPEAAQQRPRGARRLRLLPLLLLLCGVGPHMLQRTRVL